MIHTKTTVLILFLSTSLHAAPKEPITDKLIEAYGQQLAHKELSAIKLLPMRSFMPAEQQKTKKAVIVGASTGIGRALVNEFAQQGYEIGMCGRKVDLMQAHQRVIPTKSYVKQIDLTNIDSVQPALQELVNEMDGMDLMIVNAGIWPEAENGILPQNKQIELSWLLDTIKVNVMGCTAAFNFATNYFLLQGRGHIVGISSLDAERGHSLAPAYCGSKAFMAKFLEGMRNKFAQLNLPINVTEIRPGCIETREYELSDAEKQYTYWTVLAETAARDIYESVTEKEKVAYVPRRWQIISWLLTLTPDWLYNLIGGF
jgi:short-subunit dehydrogenase